MDLLKIIINSLKKNVKLSPRITKSINYKHWISTADFRRCLTCEKLHGKIWLIEEIPDQDLPVHPNCRCRILTMQSITAGTATYNGFDGADWTLKYKKNLPDYYISKEYALTKGWKRGKPLSNFVKGKMLGGKCYYNDNGHLPDLAGRIWYEADINYIDGKRNSQRILWSNDGLIFVTYYHYKTFYEII